MSHSRARCFTIIITLKGDKIIGNNLSGNENGNLCVMFGNPRFLSRDLPMVVPPSPGSQTLPGLPVDAGKRWKEGLRVVDGLMTGVKTWVTH